jgi:hypothetical protein
MNEYVRMGVFRALLLFPLYLAVAWSVAGLRGLQPVDGLTSLALAMLNGFMRLDSKRPDSTTQTRDH